MNNKEFISELSQQVGRSIKETNELTAGLLEVMSKQWQESNTITIPGFGAFEVKKKTERISVNPTTKVRMLVPPKLVLSYKPSSALKDKFK